MRGNAEAHELIAPGSLAAVLELLAGAPGEWTPIAGGTELMVAHAAGRLEREQARQPVGHSRSAFHRDHSRRALSSARAPRFAICARTRPLRAELPLLAKAASWIGSIANQSRATLGGNLVNGSPAADSSPALLVYDAEIELVSVRGKRRIPYAEFHTGYKRNAHGRRMNCFLQFICRAASHAIGSILRKVGTRRAMAIAKVALAATALVKNGVIERDSSGGGQPCAVSRTALSNRSALLGQRYHAETRFKSARQALLAEAQAHRRHSLHRRISAGAWAPICLKNSCSSCAAKGRRNESESCGVESRAR